MALSRPKQSLQKRRSQLGIRYAQDINFLIDLAKGHIPLSNKHSHFFYRLFITKTGNASIAKTMVEAQEILRNAWWIEKEDIRQFLYLSTCQVYYRGAHPKSWFLRNLGYKLANWLVRQKIGIRNIDADQIYSAQNEQPGEDNSLENLYCFTKISLLEKMFLKQQTIHNKLDNFTVFEKYLIYLSYGMELSHAKIAPLLLTSTGQVDFYYGKLKKKMENLNVRMHVSK